MDLKNNGERVDINYYKMNYNDLDKYQKSHYKRYEFISSFTSQGDIVGDMACGSGYGSLMISKFAKEVYGYDIDDLTISEVKQRYKAQKNVFFEQKNLLKLNKTNFFDKIVSFETIEHFDTDNVKMLFKIFNKALKENGHLVFSTPYNQEDSIHSRKWHKTFHITESLISLLLCNIFKIEKIYYQNYSHHDLVENLKNKNFMIIVAKKL